MRYGRCRHLWADCTAGSLAAGSGSALRRTAYEQVHVQMFAGLLTCKHRMYRALSLLILVAAFAGCKSYSESTPAKVLEDDLPANYTRVFREPVPSDVTV